MQALPSQPMMAVTNIPKGVLIKPNHIIVTIGSNWFSYCQRGDAIQFHIFSLEPKTLSDTCEIFINWVFSVYDWCKILIVTLNKKSLLKLAKKHSFIVAAEIDGAYLLMRLRNGRPI
jgi:hypothetical protein